ncbi:MAG: cereblon family protein [Myxococcota bacterium]
MADRIASLRERRWPPPKGLPPAGGSPAADVHEQAGQGAPGGRRLVCKTCGAPIARTGARMRVRGQHEHVCVNPHGIPFHLGCYREARVVAVGTPTEEWTWFGGFRWQIALCPGCGQHLGWRFTGDDVFYGLLVSRLVEVDEEGGGEA